MNKILVTITLLILAPNVLADSYYRSIDEKGNIQYSDVPVKNAADTEKLNSMSEPAADDSLPFDTRRAHKKFPVTLYVASGCGNACSDGRELLSKRGIPFAEKNLTTPEEIAAFKKESNGDQVPAMLVGTKWTIGFMDSLWNEVLNTAGYPKSAPIGAQSPAQSAPSAEKPKSE